MEVEVFVDFLEFLRRKIGAFLMLDGFVELIPMEIMLISSPGARM